MLAIDKDTPYVITYALYLYNYFVAFIIKLISYFKN